MASKVADNDSDDMLHCLNAIEALAQILQKAFEGTSDETTGVYGTAYIIEQQAQKGLQLIGQR